MRSQRWPRRCCRCSAGFGRATRAGCSRNCPRSWCAELPSAAMCRLFGLHVGTDVATATFWLLDAPDSLAEQSRTNPDGTGLGVFDEHGRPRLHKEPIAAWQDAEFSTEAHKLTGTTFVAHVRYATTGSLD